MTIATGKTKIVCTLGPATSSLESLRAMAQAGVNVVRLSFSPGTYEEHAGFIRNVVILRKETGLNIGIMQDLCGPKIRTGDLPEEGVTLAEGSVVFLEAGMHFSGTPSSALNGRVIPINYPSLLEDVRAGARILLDDGLLELSVAAKQGDRLECTVVSGGTLRAHKGVNFPGQTLSAGRRQRRISRISGSVWQAVSTTWPFLLSRMPRT
jgi:pyruvate kinase